MKMMTIVHTNMSLVGPLGDLATEILRGVGITHIVDDSLLRHARQVGVDAYLVRRMCTYFEQANDGGADLILSACSSVGDTVEIAQRLVPTPILRIDEPMAIEAVGRGGVIAVLATVESTLHPTCRLLEIKAREIGRDVEIRQYLNEGALDFLIQGDMERHDSMVTEIAEEAARDADVILFAQGSMARLGPALEQTLGKPVLTSPKSAVQEAARRLGIP